ncbi:MAG: hypothetical protein ACMUEL_08975 [Flavobacteriales bacterium Tduv]
MVSKTYRNRPLSRVVILFNKLVIKPRWVVEHTFGSINVPLDQERIVTKD